MKGSWGVGWTSVRRSESTSLGEEGAGEGGRGGGGGGEGGREGEGRGGRAGTTGLSCTCDQQLRRLLQSRHYHFTHLIQYQSWSPLLWPHPLPSPPASRLVDSSWPASPYSSSCWRSSTRQLLVAILTLGGG